MNITKNPDLNEFTKMSPTIPLIILFSMTVMFILTIVYSHHKDFPSLSDTSNSEINSQLESADLI